MLGDLTAASTYAAAGNNTTKHTTTYAYDGAQRLTDVVHPNGKTSHIAYSGRYPLSTTDEAGNQFYYTYCGCGSLTGISQPATGWSLGWTYNKDGALTAFTDARSNVTNYTYDQAGLLNKISYPDAVAGSQASSVFRNRR